MPTHRRQAAAVCSRDGLVCLVTSRNRKRWVVPKGMIKPGQTQAEAAAAEAWEESGLTGIVRPDPVGEYRYEKNGRPHAVTVFVMDVHAESEDWPEKHERVRLWLSPAEAADRVEESDLRAILLGIAAAALIDTPAA